LQHEELDFTLIEPPFLLDHVIEGLDQMVFTLFVQS